MMPRFVVQYSLGALLLFSPHLANAQVAGRAPAVSAAAVATFQANPSQLLSQFPNGGAGLTKNVSDLVGSDKATLAAIITLAKNANEDQRKAIADGLAQIAKAYAADGSDPGIGFATQIQHAVANAGLPEFARAYAAASGDTGTASTGGGGAGGGGGGPNTAGAPTGGSNGGGTTGGSTSTTTQSSGLTGGSVGSASFSQVSPR